MSPRGVLAGKTALIFDLDGTLVDSASLHRAAYETVFRSEGIETFDYERHLGQRTEEVVAEVLVANGRSAEPGKIATLTVSKQQEARSQVSRGLATIPGATEFVRQASEAGFHLAIGTGASREGALRCLEAASLRSFFDVIVTGDDVPRGKPAPDIFLRDVDLLGVAPAACLVIEDAPSGVAAARAAMLDCVIVVESREMVSGAREDVVFANYDELSKLLG